MTHRIIQKTVVINAPVEKVWRVFTDPLVTRQMGGEYVTSWKAGDPIGWKGSNGSIRTKGVIIQIEDKQLIKHDLFDLAKPENVLSLITYRFRNREEQTELHAREDIHYEMSDEQFEDTSEGWDFALASVKALAEKI